MNLRAWQRWLKNRFTSRQSRRVKKSMCIESLEIRIVPAAVTPSATQTSSTVTLTIPMSGSVTIGVNSSGNLTYQAGSSSEQELTMDKNGNSLNIDGKRLVITCSGSLANSITVDPSVADAFTRVTVNANGGGDMIDATDVDIPIVLNGGTGNDTLTGGNESDTLSGSSGNDEIYGNGGDDDLFGDSGRDYIEGGDGDDLCCGQNGLGSGGTDSDTIYGGDGNDVVNGNGGDDEVYGDDGNDYVYGGAGRDYCDGGDGLDIVKGQGGRDTITGSYDDALVELDEINALRPDDMYRGETTPSEAGKDIRRSNFQDKNDYES